MTFDLPGDQDYHIVANEGIIDNANVLHHQLLYACDPDSGELPSISRPRPCGMGQTDGCSIISAWTVGQAGQCFGSNIGFRIGASTYKRVILEIHYNNPRLVNNYVDSSGLRLYYRPARPEVQDLAMFQTGQMDIEIPPGKSRVDVVGTCPGSCTNVFFNKPVYVISVLNHMHYMGRSMKIDLFRSGRKIAELSNDDYYNYDSPVNHEYDKICREITPKKMHVAL
ncbi:dopamine beta-hydroxylase [Plakobranchus ocellatus]|uniref:Dopamine beta-hydroxylase n=1 Tax=Plakobranchus ocellatus TaxID=259542 RepID=A0AAV3YAZ6_9GAST|nr:dopamine beta-hydroxylase [Plakobranchus ocellatus]